MFSQWMAESNWEIPSLELTIREATSPTVGQLYQEFANGEWEYQQYTTFPTCLSQEYLDQVSYDAANTKYNYIVDNIENIQ